MRPYLSALSVALFFLFLSGCTPGSVFPTAESQPASVVPSWLYAFAKRAIPEHLHLCRKVSCDKRLTLRGVGEKRCGASVLFDQI